jgi:hypothetical protein
MLAKWGCWGLSERLQRCPHGQAGRTGGGKSWRRLISISRWPPSVFQPPTHRLRSRDTPAPPPPAPIRLGCSSGPASRSAPAQQRPPAPAAWQAQQTGPAAHPHLLQHEEGPLPAPSAARHHRLGTRTQPQQWLLRGAGRLRQQPAPAARSMPPRPPAAAGARG